jgi:benzil reductase ((S)-benzoin forming)
MKYIIITGSSKGLGESIVKKLMNKEHHLFCISRNTNQELINMANENSTLLNYIDYDLNDVNNIDSMMGSIFSKIDKSKLDSIYLINNAGIVAPITTVENADSQEVIRNINVNLIAPMLIASNFMKFTKDFNLEKKIINVSSGAGKKPFHGWGPYCSSKAGLDMMTQCIGLEEQNKEYPVKIMSFGPGIMDTDLQKEIRSTKEEDFILVPDFIKFQEEGKLLSADTVADVVLRLLFEIDYKQGEVSSVKDYLEQ